MDSGSVLHHARNSGKTLFVFYYNKNNNNFNKISDLLALGIFCYSLRKVGVSMSFLFLLFVPFNYLILRL